FGALAVLQEPVRIQAALTQLGHRDVEGADPGVEVAVPVAVAGVDPLRGPFTVAGAAHRVGLGREQRVDERGEQITQQIRAGLIQLLGQELRGVDTGNSGHRCVLLRGWLSEIARRIHAVAAPAWQARAHSGPSYTPLLDSTALRAHWAPPSPSTGGCEPN